VYFVKAKTTTSLKVVLFLRPIYSSLFLLFVTAKETCANVVTVLASRAWYEIISALVIA